MKNGHNWGLGQHVTIPELSPLKKLPEWYTEIHPNKTLLHKSLKIKFNYWFDNATLPSNNGFVTVGILRQV